jgi:hypothetical protein
MGVISSFDPTLRYAFVVRCLAMQFASLLALQIAGKCGLYKDLGALHFAH